MPHFELKGTVHREIIKNKTNLTANILVGYYIPVWSGGERSSIIK